MHRTALMMVMIGLAVWALPCRACIYQYGSRHEVPHWTYGYVGLDWPEEGATQTPQWVCDGTHQSPIHIPGHTSFPRVPANEDSIFGFKPLSSNGSNVKIVNNGHTVQVSFPAGYQHDASVVVKGDLATATLTSKFSNTSAASAATRVKLSPAQFHFHTHSEHVINGKVYPLEMHIVNWVYNDTLPGCGAGGCATVVGIMFELDEADSAVKNPFIDTVFTAMSSFESVTSYLPTSAVLDFDTVLPADRSYITYSGSLTTPPCTEGILWHLLTTPVTITREQLHQFELAVGETECTSCATVTAARGVHEEAPGKAATSQRALLETAATAATTTQFEVPAFTADAADGQSCRKLGTGKNYREVQDRGTRPIYFHAAPGVCDSQLSLLADRSKVLQKLVYPGSNPNNTMSLAQYQDIVASGLTQDLNCSGITSAAAGIKAANGLAVSVLVGVSAMLALLLA